MTSGRVPHLREQRRDCGCGPPSALPGARIAQDGEIMCEVEGAVHASDLGVLVVTDLACISSREARSRGPRATSSRLLSRRSSRRRSVTASTSSSTASARSRSSLGGGAIRSAAARSGTTGLGTSSFSTTTRRPRDRGGCPRGGDRLALRHRSPRGVLHGRLPVAAPLRRIGAVRGRHPDAGGGSGPRILRSVDLVVEPARARGSTVPDRQPRSRRADRRDDVDRRSAWLARDRGARVSP